MLEAPRVPGVIVRTLRCRLLATVVQCVGGVHGEATMAIRILNEVLLSCVLAFAMGVVIAAASMLQG